MTTMTVMTDCIVTIVNLTKVYPVALVDRKRNRVSSWESIVLVPRLNPFELLLTLTFPVTQRLTFA